MVKAMFLPTGLTAMLFVLCAGIAIADTWNRSSVIETHSITYYPFYVKSEAYGFTNGAYFVNYSQNWLHGPTSNGPHPDLFCAYDHTYYHFPPTNPTVVQTYSYGAVTDKSGEQVETFAANAQIYAT